MIFVKDIKHKDYDLKVIITRNYHYDGAPMTLTVSTHRHEPLHIHTRSIPLELIDTMTVHQYKDREGDEYTLDFRGWELEAHSIMTTTLQEAIDIITVIQELNLGQV